MNYLSIRSKLLKKSLLQNFFNKKITLEKKGIIVINLGVGEPYHKTPEIIAKAGIKGINNGFTHYTSIKGIMTLRKKIKNKLKKEKMNYSIDSIIISAGAKPSIGGLLSLLTNNGDYILIPFPYYPPFINAANFFGIKVIPIDTTNNNFQLIAEQIEKSIEQFNVNTKRISRIKPKVLILNSPNNPTGENYSKENLSKIAKLAIKYNLWVISDESYYEFSYYKNFISIASFSGMKKRTIIIRTLSKGYAMTGWRIGYTVGPVEVINKLALYFENMIGCPSSISQYAAREALNNDKIPIIMKKEFLNNKNLISNWLKKINIPFSNPSGAFYFFIDFSKIIKKLKMKDATQLAEYILIKTKISVIPGIAFGNKYKNYLRISYAVKNKKILTALNRLEKLFKIE